MAAVLGVLLPSVALHNGFQAPPREPAGLLVLSRSEAEILVGLRDRLSTPPPSAPMSIPGPFAVDLGKRELDHVDVSIEGIGGLASAIVPWEDVAAVAASKKDGAWEIEEGYVPDRIEVFSDETKRHASLLPVDGGCPTAVLAGFSMHRMSGTNPMKDTEEKMRALGGASGHVLDVCTGLGYTAIALASESAVESVTTIELDPGMVTLQQRNPWSSALFTSPRITRLLGDACSVLPSLPDGHFSAVVHDPPVNAIAGSLYARAFYDELYRVLRPAGKLFHYIGDPDSRASGRLYGGVRTRLRDAGFGEVAMARRAFGLRAVKT